MEVMKKLDQATYDNLFVTSDTHFNHNKEFVYRARGYETPAAMTEDMIDVINNVVGENGILLHLGDFCLNTTREQYYDILSKFKVKEIWMLWGNHNNPVQRSYGGTVQQVAANVHGTFVRFLGHYFTFRRGPKEFVCFHYPVQTWDGVNHGSMHLCGHSHGDNVRSLPQTNDGKILDCGWDVHEKPLTMKEIERIMLTKDTVLLHHD